MANKIIIGVILGLVIIGGVVLGLRFLAGGEDTWICQNGEWIKHGNPKAPKPTEPCGETKPSAGEPSKKEEDQKFTDEIQVEFPKPNEIVSSPLEVKGKARGGWYFEAVFPVRLLDSQGNEISRTMAEAQGDWMTNDFVPFAATLTFSFPTTSTGTLILANDNPSGLPENAKEIKIPVSFNPFWPL